MTNEIFNKFEQFTNNYLLTMPWKRPNEMEKIEDLIKYFSYKVKETEENIFESLGDFYAFYRGFLQSKTDDGVIEVYHEGVDGFLIFVQKIAEEFGLSK